MDHLFISSIVSLLFLLPFAKTQAPHGVHGKEVNDFQFKVRTIDGDEISQNDFKEKVLLVDIWGTWCPPCRKAVPFLSRLYDTYKDRGFEIVGLNFERTSKEKALKKVRAFADRLGIPYQLALGDQSILNQIKGFRGYPTLLFFKRGLLFDHLDVGFSSESKKKIEDWVLKALDEVPTGLSRKTVIKNASPILIPLGKGEEYVVGNGKTQTLIFFEHPNAFFSKPLKDHLLSLARRAWIPTTTLFLGRLGLGGPKGSHMLKKKDLKSLRLGRAFPSLVLYSKEGRVLFRGAGIGKEMERRMGKIAERLLVAKEAKGKENPRGERKRGAPKKVRRKKM